jgi:hypothetical protein
LDQSCAQLCVDGTDTLQSSGDGFVFPCELHMPRLRKYVAPHIENDLQGTPEVAFCCAGLRLIRQKLLLWQMGELLKNG